jgi:ammonia channel protein AmtB
MCKVTTALSTSAAIMAQMAMSEPNKSEKEMVAAFKGVVAIQFAKAGFSEVQRAPYQGLINLAIAKAVEQWVKHHPAPATLTMPVWARLQMTALK